MSEYNTGTVSVTNGSNIVVGTGTAWLANVSNGDIFTIVGSGVSYIVGSITDDTHLVLTGNYAGATAGGQAYTISTSFTSPDSIPYPELGDTQPATIAARLAAKIQDLFTTRETAFATNAAAGKDTPVDADALPLVDSADSNTLKQLTVANLKATIATWLNDLTATWSNKTLTAPDINGGTADGLASLSVAPNSNGNISRYVMRTAAATPAEANYWTKLVTFTVSTSNYQRSPFMYVLRLHASTSMQVIIFSVHVSQDTSGLATSSRIQIMSTSQGGTAEGEVAFNGLKLVGGNTNGTPAELWLQRSSAYNHFELIELMPGGSYWAPDYNDLSNWTATTPTGAVEITSDWAGSGTWTPTIIGLTTTGIGTYSVQVGYYQETNSLITLTGRIAWSAHTGTGHMAIGGFPAPAATGNQCAVQVMHQSISTLNGDLAIYIGSGLSYGSFFALSLNAAWQTIPVDTGGDIAFTITYRKS